MTVPPRRAAPSFEGEPDGDALRAIWTELEAAAPEAESPEDTDRAWSALRERMGAAPSTAPVTNGGTPSAGPGKGVPFGVRGRRPRNPVRRGLAAAAVLVLVSTGIIGVTGLPTSLEAPPGGSVTAGLPDGSVVELNSGSRLTWRRSIVPGAAPARTFSLVGEAFLTVVPGPRPFEVETFNARVTVLGTRFNVRARDEVGGGTQVTLEEGRVRMAPRSGAGAVDLAPGEELFLASGAGAVPAPRPVVLERALAWRDSGFSAVDRPLEAVLEELGRRYALDIDLAPGVDGTGRLNIHYARLGPVREVLSDISTARGLRFRETTRGFEVY